MARKPNTGPTKGMKLKAVNTHFTISPPTFLVYPINHAANILVREILVFVASLKGPFYPKYSRLILYMNPFNLSTQLAIPTLTKLYNPMPMDFNVLNPGILTPNMVKDDSS